MLWVLKYLGSILIVLMLFTQLNAQELSAKIEESKSVTNDKIIDEHSILYDLDKLLPDRKLMLDATYPKRIAPGEIQYKYDGVQGVIVSRMLSYYRRYSFSSLNSRFNSSSMTPCDYDRMLYAYSCA